MGDQEEPKCERAEDLYQAGDAPPLPDKEDLSAQELFVVNFPPPYSEGGEECIKPNDKEKKDVDEMMIEAQMYFRNGEPLKTEEEDEFKEMKKKKTGGFCLLSGIAVIFMIILAFQLGKRAGFWKGHHHGERGCGFHSGYGSKDDGHWGDRHHEHRPDDTRSCDFRMEGDSDYNRGDICTFRDPIPAVEYDSNVDGEEGSRWIMLQGEDKEGRPYDLQILDFYDVDGEHVCMVMEHFFAETGDITEDFEQFEEDVIKLFPEASSMEFSDSMIHPVYMSAQELHGREGDHMSRKTMDYCYDDSQMYLLTRQDREATVDYNCVGGREEEFMMPVGYHEKPDGSSSYSLGMYKMCIHEEHNHH
ncbi:uncharacterized protein LOC134842103 [Symsagittifera roscoffensis]|uniref:uncharacterized protein LOC134842103 n=1 Tax=Symsagittifera roscoffensis TaxID=84072 RepID=UPI00307BDDAB